MNFLGLHNVAKSLYKEFPPYDLTQVDEKTWKIETAVAGYTSSELSVTMDEGMLIIRGKKPSDGIHEYVHKGIQTGPFSLSFGVGSSFEVKTVDLSNGILRVVLETLSKQPKTFEINVPQPSEALHPTILNENSPI